jgi:hypothetical protein
VSQSIPRALGKSSPVGNHFDTVRQLPWPGVTTLFAHIENGCPLSSRPSVPCHETFKGFHLKLTSTPSLSGHVTHMESSTLLKHVPQGTVRPKSLITPAQWNYMYFYRYFTGQLNPQGRAMNQILPPTRGALTSSSTSSPHRIPLTEDTSLLKICPRRNHHFSQTIASNQTREGAKSRDNHIILSTRPDSALAVSRPAAGQATQRPKKKPPKAIADNGPPPPS